MKTIEENESQAPIEVTGGTGVNNSMPKSKGWAIIVGLVLILAIIAIII